MAAAMAAIKHLVFKAEYAARQAAAKAAKMLQLLLLMLLQQATFCHIYGKSQDVKGA